MTQQLTDLVEQFCNFSASSAARRKEEYGPTDGSWSSS
jgi:hypothetical protein